MNSIVDILVLVLVGFIAGSINTIAGGGYLLILPVLIFLGLPPNIANGTNRIAIFFQNIFTSAGFRSKGISTFPFSIYIGVSALFGSIVGAQMAVNIKGEIFNKILAVIMVFVVVYMVIKSKSRLSSTTVKSSGKHLWLSIFLFFFVGVYGGFIQAGVGFVILLILSSVNNFSLLKSNAIKVNGCFNLYNGCSCCFCI